MRIWFLALLLLGTLQASPISTPLLEVQGDHGAIESPELKVGMSGFVIHHFDDTHSSIIANVHVFQTTPSSNRALVTFSAFDGLHQNSLPSGTWKPLINDEVVLAYDYTRALLVAPNDESYNTLTKNIPNVEWVHPDLYATYLSHEGHPTPLISDFHRFCTSNSIGLLYVQSAETLFTLDCKKFSLLQSVNSHSIGKDSISPFYTRVPNIRSAWWGEGSSKLESYEPYYLEQIALNNPKNKELYELYKAKFGDKSALLRHFDLKE